VTVNHLIVGSNRPNRWPTVS